MHVPATDANMQSGEIWRSHSTVDAVIKRRNGFNEKSEPCEDDEDDDEEFVPT